MVTMTERQPATRAGTPWERKGPDTRRSPFQRSHTERMPSRVPPAGGQR